MIWKRYFYKEIFKTFFFLLFGFYALYIAIDVMTHLKDIKAGKTSFSVWVTYYLATFSRRLDVLVPFAVLIGSIRIYNGLQARNELVALLVSGVPMRRLLQPFFIAALSFSLLLYLNFEYFLPRAQPKALAIQENDFGKKLEKEDESNIREVLLKDASRLFYTTYDPTLKQFSDVFWIVNIDKVYHMKQLTCFTNTPIGTQVDYIVRSSDGNMVVDSTYSELVFPNMEFDEESLLNSIQLPRDQSISTLFAQAKLYGTSTSDRAIDVRSYLFYKLLFPLIAILAAFAPVRYTLSFRRDMPHFMVYLLSLGALFCFFLLLQVALVLAKSHVVSPASAIVLPWLAAMLFVSKNVLSVLNGKA